MEAIEKFPEEVIHVILSSLGARDGAKASVLSKVWLRAWQTQPILQCDENYFPSIDEFAYYVEFSLVRYQEKKINIEKLKLVFKKGWIFLHWTGLLDGWIKAAMDLGLKKLELVDSPIFLVFKSELLEDLSLSFSLPMKISCVRLKRLSFSHIKFNKGTFENILSICQLIEFLNLNDVRVYREKLKVQARNLKELHVVSCECKRLEVEAPNLEIFTCCFYSCRGAGLYLETTRNLKFLKLRCCVIKLFGYNQIVPKLETLKIQNCPGLYDLKVSCFNLKSLSFSQMRFHKGTLENVLSICQLIEFLNLDDVDVYGKKLQVQARNLKELHARSCTFGTVEVEAPNLEVFTYCLDVCVSFDDSCWLYLETTQNLKFLKLQFCRIIKLFGYNQIFPKLETLIIQDCQGLYDLGYNQFPKLQNLKIQDCPDLYHDLKVSSQASLKNVYVDGSSGLEYLSVESLNTIQFDYYTDHSFIPIVSFTNLSKGSVSNICLDVLDARKFWRLKKLLGILMPSKISVSICRIINADVGKRYFDVNILPIPVHQLLLSDRPLEASFGLVRFYRSSSMDFSTIVEGIFCTCRPTLVKLRTGTSGFDLNHEFTKFLVWKLTVERDQDYCDSKERKSWQRDLLEVKVDFCTRNDTEEWKPGESWDWETFINMIGERPLLIFITCDWEKSSYAQEAQ